MSRNGGDPGKNGRVSEVAEPGSAGVAVARGDARRRRGAAPPRTPLARFDSGRTRDTAEDPADALAGNPLRSLGVVGPGGVLDGSFELLRFGFRRLLALTAVLFLPLQLLDLLVALRSGPTATATDAADPFASLQVLDVGGTVSGRLTVCFVALQALALFFLGMAAGHLVDGWLGGRDDPFATVVAAVARRAWVAPLVLVVALPAKAAATCFGGAGFFLVDALLFIAGPLAGAERIGPWATIGRSVSLAKGAYGSALAICFGGFAITSVLRFALTLGPLALVSFLGLPEWFAVLADQIGSLTMLITMPMTACIAARAYVDLRCRVEGFDLSRRMTARGLV